MGFIPDDIISQVLDRCDIVETISGYIPLKRAGQNFKAACPFHNEKTPSFVVNPKKQIFHCFGCGVGGNVITFVMQQERMEFPEAIRYLADKVGIIIPEASSESKKVANVRQLLYKVNQCAVEFYHRALLSDNDRPAKAARNYLKGRGVVLDMVKTFQLGFATDEWERLLNFLRQKGISLKLMEKAGLILPNKKGDGFYDRFRNRIIFPIFDIRSRCVGFGARAMGDETAKYINSPETDVYQKGRHLYGFHLAKDGVAKKDFVIVTEGYMDFITPFAAGVDNIVASLGTALTIDQIRLLRRYTKNVVMLFDTDQAGAAAMIRSFDALIEEGMNVKIASLTAGEDPDSFIRKSGVERFYEQIKEAQPLFEYKLRQLMQQYDSGTLEGRAQIAGEMLPTVNKFPNAILRSGYIKELAKRLMISEDALLAEQKKHSTPSKKPQIQKAPSPQPQAPRMAEYNILRLLLREDELIPAVKEEITLSDFQDERIKNIINQIFVLFKEGRDVSISNLINCFQDKTTLNIIAQIAASEETIEGDRARIFQDCISRIKNDRHKLTRRELMVRIREAEEAGDHQKLEELKIEFNHLIKG